MFIQFSIRDMLKRDLNVDLPISGGTGKSADPVVVESAAGKEYQRVETDFIKCDCLGRRVKWEFLKRESLESEGRKIEKVKIKTQAMTQEEVISQIENYYFDVTDCLVPPSQRQKTHRDFPDLINVEKCQVLTFDITESIDQTKAQANWLSKWLSSAVGDPVKVLPMVTVPGWFIKKKSPNGLPVLNPKQVKSYLNAKKEEVLSDSMIKRICHQLEEKCRDVDLWEWY